MRSQLSVIGRQKGSFNWLLVTDRVVFIYE